MATALNKLGGALSTLVGIILLLIVFVGPWLVYDVFPIQAYRLTEAVAFIAFAIGLVALVASVFPPVRPFTGITLSIAALGITPFWWVWSVIIVGQHWGIGTLYFLNLFLGVGTLLGAAVASLFSGQWGVLGQLILIALIVIIFNGVGTACRGEA